MVCVWRWSPTLRRRRLPRPSAAVAALFVWVALRMLGVGFVSGRLHSTWSRTARAVQFDDKINLPTPRPIHDPSEAGDWEEGGKAAEGPDDGLPRWFLELNVAGFEPDLKFYGKFIQEAATRGDLRAAERWLQNAKRAQVEPDGDIYRFLCLAASKSDLAAAAKYGTKASQLGTQLDQSLLASLLSQAVDENQLPLVEAFASLLSPSNDPSNVSVYESVLRAAAAQRDFHAADRWLRRAEEERVALGLQVVVALMDAAACEGNLTMAEAFFKYAKDSGIQHEMASYNILIKAAAEARLPEAGEYWYFQARKENLQASLITYTSLIRGFARAGDLSGAESWLRQADAEGLQLDIQIFTAVMDAAARKGNHSAAEYWYRESVDRGGRPNVVTFNTLISAASRAGDTRSAERWFHTCEDAGLVPNIKTFNILMNAAAKRNDLNATEHWFQVALTKGVKPDAAMLQTLLTTVVHHGDEVAASRWYHTAKKRSVQLSSSSVGSVAIAAARKGQLEFARSIVEDGYQQMGLEFDLRTYIALAQESSKQGLLNETQSWQKLAKKHGLPEDIAFYDAVLTACAKSPYVKASHRLAVETFERAQQAPVKLRLTTFNAMINAVGREGLRLAERWFAKTIEAGLRPDRVTFTIMVSVAAKHRDLQSAEGWFRAAQDAGIKADVVMYSALLDAAAKTGKPDLADEWFKELLAQGLIPDTVAYTTLMEAHARAGEMTRARGYFAEMESFEQKPTVESYSAIINGYARLGNLESAAKWFGDMERKGLIATVIQFNQLLRACAESSSSAPDERKAFAEEVFQRMLERGISPSDATLQALKAAGASRFREIY
ncbi:unnamed protein product [Durusdinium trenchii]|uniref:Uncharacterized protein n=1 Tax=Durusdinium trenchii TaxID=1381693 RepID=A0ABP0I558_9DINO